MLIRDRGSWYGRVRCIDVGFDVIKRRQCWKLSMDGGVKSPRSEAGRLANDVVSNGGSELDQRLLL